MPVCTLYMHVHVHVEKSSNKVDTPHPALLTPRSNGNNTALIDRCMLQK